MQNVLLLGSVVLLALGQVLQKLAATRRLAGTRSLEQWLRALLSPELIGSAVCLVAGTGLWLLVLYRMDVSRAFPGLSLGAILVLVVSRFYLRESVSLHRWAGAVLIAIGVALISAS